MGLKSFEFFLGHFFHVRVGKHGFGFGDGVGYAAVLAIFFDDGFHVAVFLGDGLEFFLVVDEVGVGHVAAEGFVAGFHLGEAVKHGGAPWGREEGKRKRVKVFGYVGRS